jgi:hypothetical protein
VGKGITIPEVLRRHHFFYYFEKRQ